MAETDLTSMKNAASTRKIPAAGFTNALSDNEKANQVLPNSVQWNHLKSAIEEHISTLQDAADDVPWCVVICDETETVVHLIGNSELVHRLNWHGIETHKRPAVDLHSLPDGLQSRIQSIVGPSGHQLGTVAVVSPPETEPHWLKMLVRTIAYTASKHAKTQWRARDTTLMYQSVLSHLDYHVVRLGQDGSQKTYHPIPLQDDVRNQMLDFAREHPEGQWELTLGERLFSALLCTWTYPDGSPSGRLGLFRDITQERRMEWQMRDADRINVLASLAAGIAHEIRNPLTTAKGFLQLFKERQVGMPERRYLDLTIQELDRIQQLVKDFMSLTRPEQPKFHKFDLAQVIDEVVHFMRPEATLHGVTLNIASASAPLNVTGDSNQIKQVLMNILQNALQACQEKGTVTIGATAQSSSAIVSVTDTGAGLTRDQLSRVFQPFYTTKAAGTGLGLAICRQIMNEHGGSIQMKSEPGAGTTVTLQLPLSQ